MNSKSPLDEFFNELYGFYPKKHGTAYELIVGAAIKIVTGNDVLLNQYLKGNYSNTPYQIDGILDQSTMIEAKDYSMRGKPVARGDLQKMQGSLTDLPFENGFFASATGYTKYAKNYAESSKLNPMQKGIELYQIRPSTKSDEKGRILQVTIEIVIIEPDFYKGKYKPVLTKESEKQMIKLFSGQTFPSYRLDSFYFSDNSLFCTMEEWTLDNPPLHVNFEDKYAIGCWLFHGKFMKFEDQFFELLGIEYNIPYQNTSNSFIVKPNGSHKLLIKSEDGRINKLLTDEELRKITFE